MRAAILCLLLLATSTARADEVAGVVIDDANAGIAGARVRVITDAVVITARADERGQFRINGVQSGGYRIEVDRGTVREPYPPPVRIDPYGSMRCCFCRVRTYVGSAPARRGHVDTRSTAQGLRISSPGR